MKKAAFQNLFSCKVGRVLAVLGMCIVISAGMLRAQTPSPSPTGLLPFTGENVVVSFYSPLERVNALTLSANGVIIDTSSVANFILPANGAVAHIIGDWLPNGVVRARTIETSIPNVLPGIVELAGRLNTFGMDFFTLTDDAGVIHTVSVNGTGITMPNAQIGQPIRVFAVAVAPQLWFARGISVLNMDRIQPPVVTQEIEAIAPVTTPDVENGIVVPPVVTPEISGNDTDDDDSGSGGGGDEDGDNSGSGGGGDEDDDNSGSGS